MKKYLILALLGLTLFSCSDKDDETVAGTETNIKLSGSINAMGTRATSLDQQSTAIVAGRQLGGWIADANSQEAFYSNILLTAGAGGSLVSETEMLWGNHVSADVYAYHPYNSNWTFDAPNVFSVATDQSTDEGYLSSDLLYGLGAGTNTNSTAINLSFSHKLAKMNITLIGEDFTGATVNILTVKTGTTLNLSDGKIGEATGNGTTLKAAVLTAGANTASAIIVPQTVASGKFIEVISGSKKYYYSLPATKEFREKVCYNYTLKVAGDGSEALILAGNSIEDWNNESVQGTLYPEEEGPEEPGTEQANIGDFYYADGTYSSTLADGCVGVVFYVSSNGGRAVSLDEVGLNWSTEEIEVGCIDEYDGSVNTHKIMELGTYSAETYPSVAWCVSKSAVGGKGWYLPAIEELKTLCSNKDIVNASLREANGAPLVASTSDNGYYLSSNERPDHKTGDAWGLNFETGQPHNCYKPGCSWARTRAVIAF